MSEGRASRAFFAAAVIAGGVALVGMLSATVTWMTIPDEIVYRQSSPVPTGTYRIGVTQHGATYYVTDEQKRTLDRIHWRTPRLWFGSLGLAVIAILAGAAARLRIPFRTPSGG